VMQKDTNFPNSDNTNGPQGNTMNEDLLSTHIELFRSPRIVKLAIENCNLESTASIAQQIRSDKDPVKYIISHLNVTKGGEGRAKDAHVLRATFRDPSAEDCATILGAVVESYQDFLGEQFQNTSAEAMTLIAKAKDDTSQKLQEAEAAYLKFRKEAPLLWNGDESSNLHLQRLANIETELAQVNATYTRTKSRLDVIEEALGGAAAESLTDLHKLALISAEDTARMGQVLRVIQGDANAGTLPGRSEEARAKYNRYVTLLLLEKTLLADLGLEHPRVEAVRAQIGVMEKFFQEHGPPSSGIASLQIEPDDLLAINVQLLRSDLSELEKRRAQLEVDATREEGEAKKLVTFELRGEVMAKDLTRKEDLHQAVIERLKQIDLIKDYGGYITEVISPVEQAKSPASPVLLLSLALGGILGLFGGAGMAYVTDIADRTFHNPEQLRQALALPLMGHVPGLVARDEKADAGDAKSPIHPTLVCHHRPRSRHAEAFRGLRTALFFSTHVGGHKVIQVTSPNPGDGKSTITANLAISMAQSGKKVLVIDCDFRHSTVDRVFGIDAEAGVSNVLVDEAELSDVIQPVGIEGLSVLPCGPHPPNPSELLTLPRFEQLIKLLREQYDFVLVDSPPMLAVSDPAVVAPRVDGVLLTVRINKNGRPQAMQAREMLTGLGVDVLGVIVNGWEQDRNYGYGYYNSKYGYGQYGGKYGHSYYYTKEGSDRGAIDSHYYLEDESPADLT